MPVLSFSCLFVNFQHISHLVIVYIVDFEHVIAGRVTDIAIQCKPITYENCVQS